MPTKTSYKKFDNKEYQRVWYIKNKIKHNKASKEWNESHREERRKYYLKNINRQKKRDKERYDKKREKILTQKKEYYEKNRRILLNKHKEWENKNKDILREKRKKYYQKNIDKIKKENKIYHKYRIKTDILYRLRTNSRRRINLYLKLKDLTKKYKYSEYIGCLPKELKLYIEDKFTSGMSWGNYGKWHIDHIIPLSSAEIEDDVYKLCHFSNLQPLWAKDNSIKGKKYETKISSTNLRQ